MNDKKLIGIAGALGAVAALLAFLYLQSVRRTYVSYAETKPVVVARKYIPAWSRVEANLVEVRQVPGNAVQPGALSDPARVVGQLALAPMDAGEQMLSNKLAAAGSQLSSYIPKGMRGLTLSADSLSTQGGLLRPGDSVDLVSTFEVQQQGKALQVTGTLLEDVRVAAIGSRFTNEDNGVTNSVADTVTLVVAPEEAELLTFAEERGKLRFALRSPGDTARSRRKVVSFKAVVDRLMGDKAAD